MGKPCGQRRGRGREATPETALGIARHPAGRRRLAGRAARTDCSAPGTTGGRRTCWTTWSTRSCATRSPSGRQQDHAGRSAHIGCATTDPGSTTTTTTWRGWRWRLSGPAGSAGVEKPERAEEAVRAVRQRVGARGRRRHPVAQAGPVLQRPRQRSCGDLPRPLRRPAAARPADVRLDRRNADRSGDPSGVRRHQGRLAGARAVHLLPGRGARAGNRTRGADQGHRPRQAGASARRRRARQHGARRGDQGRRRRRRRTVQRHPGPIPGAGGDHAAAEQPRGRRGPRHRPHAGAASPRSRHGTTARPSTACRCSPRSGTAPPRYPRQAGRKPSSSRVRSTPPRSPNAICLFSCRAGC